MINLSGEAMPLSEVKKIEQMKNILLLLMALITVSSLLSINRNERVVNSWYRQRLKYHSDNMQTYQIGLDMDTVKIYSYGDYIGRYTMKEGFKEQFDSIILADNL